MKMSVKGQCVFFTGPDTFNKPTIPAPLTSYPGNHSNHSTPSQPPLPPALPSLPPRHPGTM